MNGRTIGALTALLLWASVDPAAPVQASAKVASVAIEKVHHGGDGPYVRREFSGVETGPLVMESVHGNPMITYRTYIATGVETDHARFTEAASERRRFSGAEMINGELYTWRLDSVPGSAGFGTSLRSKPSGVYSVYVTADDGEGESPPSNILTFELMPHPRDVVSQPVISAVRSPAAGIVILHVEPMRYSGEGDLPLMLAVFRADGATADSSSFRAIGSRLAREVRYFTDSSRGFSTSVCEVTITGLKSGERSFFLQVQLERGLWAPSIRSAPVTVDITGSSLADDWPDMYYNFLDVAGIEETEHSDVSLHPNPARNSVELRTGFDGEAKVTIVGAHGAIAKREVLTFTSGSTRLDLATLTSGHFVVIVERNRRRYAVPLVVAR